MTDEYKKFEQSHIQVLQEERERIQAKTFTKWINSHLSRANMKIEDIFNDLKDGKVLMTLLEVISNVNLGKRNRGTLRVQKIEDVNKALKYIQTKVTLENIGAEDIVDGNHRLILGLIWTIILRFQIQEMMIETESGEKKSAKDALLLWCQRKTKDYKNVDIKDFQKSWRDGMAFNALIHAHRPDLLDYDKIVPEQHQKNLTQAFTIAEKELGVPALLEPEDIDVERPDDKSIMTYVSSLYMTFAKMKTENTGAKRVGKILSNALEIANMIDDYEKLVKSLLQWIQRKIVQLNDRNFPNSRTEMQKEMIQFKEYRTVEKPPKFADRSKIDEKLFQIIIKQKENNMKHYVPPEGLIIKEVEVAWQNLEKAEHEREMALREELLRQEKLEQAAEKFKKKADLRDTWLKEMVALLNKMDSGNDIKAIEAQINKNELVGNEINASNIHEMMQAKKERFQMLKELAENLESNNYYNKDAIAKRNADIQDRWKKLQEIFANKQSDSNKLAFLLSILRILNTIKVEYECLKPQINCTEFGKHLMAAENLLEKHNLVDSQLKALSDRYAQTKYKARDFLDSMKSQNLSQDHRNSIENQLKTLTESLDNLNKISQQRREQLIQNCNYHKLLGDLEEEENWLSNQTKTMTNTNTGHDYSSVLRLIRTHEVYESEINAHKPIYNKLKESASEFTKTQSSSKVEIEKHLNILKNGWDNLEKVKLQRRNLLKDAYECQKYYADADDAQQWIIEHFPLVLNKENGTDEGASQALLKRHAALSEEISTFGDNDMRRLRELVTLMTKPLDKHEIRPENIENLKKTDSLEAVNKIQNNMIQITVEDEDDNNRASTTDDDEWEWYYAISDYASQTSETKDISLIKDQPYKVLKKPSNDWWMVENPDKKKGFAPANYLKPQDKPKMRHKKIKSSKPLVTKWIPIDSDIAKNYLDKQNRKSMHTDIFKGPVARNQDELHYDKVNIEKRQINLDKEYDELVGLTKARLINLQASSLSHQFFKECDDFMNWMKEKENDFNQRGSIATDVEGIKKKYEAIIDDLAANSGRINYINDLSTEIQKINPSAEVEINKVNSQNLAKIPFPVDKAKVISRHKEINNQWDKLNKLKCEKEKSLAGASSIDLFNKTGDELQESINQKLEALNDDNVGFDKESNEALKRKFQNLVRDADAIKTRIARYKYLGDGVRETYPTESKYVDGKIKDIDDLYNKLQLALEKRKNDLNNAGNVHKFLNDSKENEQRINELIGKIENQIIPKDVSSVESCMQQHEPLKYEIKSVEANLDKLKALANQVLKDRPNDTNVLSTMDKLNGKMKSLKEKEAKRSKDLEDALEAQKFYKECDQIESIVSQQACKLDSINPQLSVDDVENALKNHANLASFIDQIDIRVQKLSSRKEKLKSNPEIEKITDRNNKVAEKTKQIHNKCDKKKKDLDNDLEFAKFKETANELNEWIDDKLIIIQEENYKELYNLPEKLKQHRALEAEIKSNITSLEKVNDWGNALLKNNHPKSDLIKPILQNINEKWSKLNRNTDDKEKKLHQANDQKELNEDIDDMLRKFEAIENTLKTAQTGTDLPSAKNLIGKHNVLESELANQNEKLLKLKQKANEMAGENHFDKENILESIKNLELKLSNLTPCAKKRKEDLENNLKRYQYAFDVDQELQWIEEHRPLVTMTDCGRSLADAVKLAKKHKKLVTEISGHKPVITKLLDYGKVLISEVGPVYKKDIETRSKELKDDWDRLEKQAEDRKYKLDLSAEGRQLLDDFSDIDQWITEKSYYVNQSDKDLDSDQIENRIKKLKNLNVDLMTYDNLLKKVGQNANTFKETCKKNNTLPELVEAVNRKCSSVTDKFDSFKASLNEKQNLLENSQDFQVFQAEVTDLEGWIEEKQKIADNNEFGEDLQQLQHLKDNWNNQMKLIDLGEERIQSCQNKGQEMVKNQNSQSKEIMSLLEDIDKEWKRLGSMVDNKNDKFGKAEELHQFNKLCKDFIDLIDTDNISLPSKCKDKNSIASADKRFKTFAIELEQMETQLNDIIETANGLKSKYPNFAENIDNEVDHINDLWKHLLSYRDEKNDQLQYSIDYLNLYANLKETMDFLNDINIQIKTDRQINSVLAAEEQKAKAKECQDMLDKHQDTLKNLVKFSEDIISDDACDNVDEIQKDIDDMLTKNGQTDAALKKWMQKAEQVLIQQTMFKEVHQINSSTAFQEVKVKVNNFDLDLEETQKHLIKHRNFAHNISVTDDRAQTLSNNVGKLKEMNHFDINNISGLVDDCIKRRQHLHDNYRDIESKLNNQLSWLTFLRDTDDKNFWIDEKLQQMKTLDKSANTLEEKMHLLQKYKAFEAEISANEVEYEKLKATTEELLKSNHPKSKEIESIFKNLMNKWNQLLSESKYRSTALKEAKDLLMFFDELDAVEAWHREKEFLVSANELGTDLDHCISLQAKLTEPVGGKQVDEARIDKITRTADELLRLKTVPPAESENIKSRSKDIKSRWDKLKTELDAYGNKLDEAYKMHNYYSELGLLSDQIKDRIKLMKVKDYGSDIVSVEKLKRKQNAIERDIIVLNDKFHNLRNLDAFGDNLNAEHSIRISLKQKEIGDDLDELAKLTKLKTELLNLSHRYFKIQADARVLCDLSSKQSKAINESVWPEDSKATKVALKVHDDIRSEMNSRKIKENRIIDLCRKLKDDRDAAKSNIVDEGLSIPPSDEQLNSVNDNLQKCVKETQNSWNKRQDRLNEFLHVFTFIETCEAEKQWLLDQNKQCDAIVTNLKSVATVEDVNELMEGKRSIASIVSTREKKSLKGTLLESLDKLRQEKVQDLELTENKYKQITESFNKLNERLQKIHSALNSEKELQDLDQRIQDLTMWMRNKMLIASDANYEDKVNLSNKIKKHKEFQSEVKANEPDIKNTVDFGRKLINENHTSSEEINDQITDLQNQWDNLTKMSDFKMQRLLETNDEVLWVRRVEGFISWIEEKEHILQSQECGTDLISVVNLKRKKIDIEVDIESHNEQLQNIHEDAKKMISSDNYLTPEIKDYLEAVNGKFLQLKESLKIHSDNLKDMEIYYQFDSDVYYELDWIQDKLRLANKAELGSSLAEADRFLKQHSLLTSDIAMRSKAIETIKKQALELENRNHYAKDKIKSHRLSLNESYNHLCSVSENRAAKLSANMQYQQFASDVIEIEMRINDKILLLNNFERGNDEQTCQNLLKKIDGLNLEIDVEKENVAKLAERDQDLSSEYQVKAKDSEKNLQKKLDEIKEIILTKRTNIMSNLKFYQYSRESEEILVWIKNLNTLVTIEEYGKDYDDCLGYLEKFENYNQTLNANKNKITTIKNTGKQLISEKNPFSSKIEKTNSIITDNMNELKENFKIRKEALLGALEVHSFVRESNDLIDWIKNKNIEISSANKVGGDVKPEENDSLDNQSDKTEAFITKEFNQPLSVVRKMENDFSKFERDLEAVKSQIEKSNKEATNLENKYPDAKDHIMDKNIEVENIWKSLTNAVVERKNRLNETKQLQVWLLQYKDLVRWIKNENIKITSVEVLPTDVSGAELLIVVSNEQKLEIDSKASELNKLIKNGDEIKANSKFIGHMIEKKRTHVQKAWDNMCNNLKNRREMYEQNLDLRKYLNEVSDLEKWLSKNEQKIQSLDEKSFKNVPEIEEATKNHEDYMKYIDSEKVKFDAIKRATKLENAFKERLENEKATSDSLWSGDVNANIKRRETHRNIQEKRKENESLHRSGSGSLAVQQRPIVEDVRSRKLLKKQASAGQLDIKPTKPLRFTTPISNISEESGRDITDEAPVISQSVKKVTSFSTKKRDPLKTEIVRSYSDENISIISSKSQISGSVSRKQVKTKGLRAAVRSWKEYFAVLEGHSLKFYKDKAVNQLQQEVPLVSDDIKKATITYPKDYTKRTNVILVTLEDLSEFYLHFKTPAEQIEWFNQLKRNSMTLNFKSDLIAQPKSLSKYHEVDSSPIDVSTVIHLDVPAGRLSSSSIEEESRVVAVPSPTNDEKEPKPVIRHKNLPKDAYARPVTTTEVKGPGRTANHDHEHHYYHRHSLESPPSPNRSPALLNRSQISSIIVNKAPPVSLSLIRSRQMSIEEKAKSMTLSSNEGDQSPKKKPKRGLGIPWKSHSKKDADKSDEV